MPYQCTEADRARILAYIEHEPEMNLFFYGDIENYGVESPQVNVFAFLNETGGWDSLLLRYFDFYILYSQTPEYSPAPVAEFLRQRTVDCVSGKTNLLEMLAPFFPQWHIQPTYMSRCNRLAAQPPVLPPDARLQKLGPAQLQDRMELLLCIQEFSASYGTPEAAQKDMERNLEAMEKGSLFYGVYQAGRLVACASTSADNSQSAMVVGVATHPDFRGRGYASAAVTALCEASFEAGRRFLCLFYDNPTAGRIYRRLGFEELGGYGMLR